jgi:hypothetical protein
VYGASGKIPSDLLHQLTRINPDSVYVLKGGMEQWRKSVLFPDLSHTNLEIGDLERVRLMSRYFGGDPFVREEGSAPGSRGFRREGC